VFVNILAVARNEAEGGRYPFPFSMKLGSHERMIEIIIFCFCGVLEWLRGARRGVGVKKKPDELK
jgi:hypothetical protein